MVAESLNSTFFMSEIIRPAAEWSATLLEAAGIAVIIAMAIYALGSTLFQTFGSSKTHKVYETGRQILGRGILFGLEFLVAADIIHTVAVDLTFRTVGVLAVVVLIRTFLSFTLDVELTGHWPWQQKRE